MERNNVWKDYTKKEIKELEKLNKQYREFLDAGKTERECVMQAITMAENSGDVSFAVGTSFCAGDYDIYKVMQNADERMYRDKREYYRTHPEKDRRKRKEQ